MKGGGGASKPRPVSISVRKGALETARALLGVSKVDFDAELESHKSAEARPLAPLLERPGLGCDQRKRRQEPARPEEAKLVRSIQNKRLKRRRENRDRLHASASQYREDSSEVRHHMRTWVCFPSCVLWWCPRAPDEKERERERCRRENGSRQFDLGLCLNRKLRLGVRVLAVGWALTQASCAHSLPPLLPRLPLPMVALRITRRRRS